MQIYKDYFLKDGTLLKENIKEDKHLIWRPPFNGSPAIDADKVWDKYKDSILQIAIKTNKNKTFTISKDDFDRYKQIIFYKKTERQYIVERIRWKIETQVEVEVEEKEPVPKYKLEHRRPTIDELREEKNQKKLYNYVKKINK